MPKTEESFDDYIADAELYKIDVTKLDAKKARRRLFFHTILDIGAVQVLIWMFFYAPFLMIFPNFAQGSFFLGGIIILAIIAFILNFMTWANMEYDEILGVYTFFWAAIGQLVLFIASILYVPGVNTFIVFLPAPWNWTFVIFFIGVYIWLLYKLKCSEQVEKHCKAIYASKCIDFDRKLYCTDLDNRIFENNVKPTKNDRFLVGMLIAITPFIQVAILEFSSKDTSTTAIISTIVMYCLSLFFMAGALDAVFKYRAIKKIQKDLGYRLTPIMSNRKRVSFAKMGWYR